MPVLELFFSNIAAVLTQFASEYNLALERYYHQEHSWRFNFRHPKGGAASIEVMKESETQVKVYNYWWLDDYDKFTRYAKQSGSEVLEREQVNSNLLENHLREILSWDIGDWTQITTCYEEFWKHHGRDFIEKDVERFPLPRI